MKKNITADFKAAFQDKQYDRMARELVRLKYSNSDPLEMVKKVLEWSFEKLEHGMGHSYIALVGWLELYEEFKGDLKKEITCLTEAFDHISKDVLRHPTFPYARIAKEFSQKEFLKAMDDEDEELAGSLILGAWEQGNTYTDLEEVLSVAALSRYNATGMGITFVYYAGKLASLLDDRLMDKIILLSLTRRLIFAPRENCTPDFRNYSLYLEQFEKIEPPGETVELEISGLFGRKIDKTMEWIVDTAVTASYEDLFDALCEVNARNFLQFDLKHQSDWENPVTQNIDLLTFAIPINFANSGRYLCQKYPDLRKEVLLQLACFYGRYSPFIKGDFEEKPWEVVNQDEFIRATKDHLIDHGLSDNEVSTQLLILSLSIFDELDKSENEKYKDSLKMGLNRTILCSVKGKHVGRTINQSIKMIEKDFSI